MDKERDISQHADETDEGTRREVLAKMGKYAAYTAPALVALTLPTEGHATGWRWWRKRRRKRRIHTSSHTRY